MVTANILDPIHDTLDPTVWDHPETPQPKLKPEHKRWIINHITTALTSAGYTHVHEWLSLVLTGSLTTYQYSPESDCDVSLFVDTEHFPEWSRAEMIGIMISKVDGVKLPGTTHPMQDFVVNSKVLSKSDLYAPGLRAGYDILTGTWISPPDPTRSRDVAKEEAAMYSYAMECADKMERLLRYEPDKAVDYWHQLHRKRMRDQTAGKGDYAESNIIYKFLEKRGLFASISQASGEYIAKTGAYFNQESLDRVRDIPDVMYHVSPVRRRQGILERGLLPDAERINTESDHPGGVYLWDDPEVAMRYRGQGPNMYRDMDIHAVQAPRHTLVEDPWFQEHHQDRAADFPGAYYSPEAITPDRIHPFYDSPWHPRQSKSYANHQPTTTPSDWKL